jgi:DNA polymerase III alpha subunit
LYTSQWGKYQSSLDLLEAIPEDDDLTADMVQNGRTIGCFQIESPGMRATLKEVNARSVDDIMVALALYRPGPLTGGLKDAFVQRHRGEAEVTHLHPSLAPLLEDTYGVILYQEQVLRIAHELAGLSLADADTLRRAMSHFDPGEQMKTLKEKFIAGANQHSGVPGEVAERVWELMAAFAGYGFPKAHAASYAQVAWRAAWCKSHYPAIFMAAVLANWGGYYSQRVYLMEARRMGLTIRPPDVNYSQREFSVSYIDEEPVLYMGLDQVRDLTRQTQANILAQRPFQSWGDFLARVDPRPVEAQNLVRAGSLEGFGTIPGLLSQLDSGGWRGGQLSLFAPTQDDLEDWTLEEKVTAQEDILGVGVIAHRLELVAEQIQALGALNTVEAAGRLGERVKVAGMRQIWRRFGTSRGDYLYFMSLEDLDGMLDVVIYADVYRRYRKEFSDHGPYLIEGLLELDANSGETFIRAERIEHLSPK